MSRFLRGSPWLDAYHENSCTRRVAFFADKALLDKSSFQDYCIVWEILDGPMQNDFQKVIQHASLSSANPIPFNVQIDQPNFS